MSETTSRTAACIIRIKSIKCLEKRDRNEKRRLNGRVTGAHFDTDHVRVPTPMQPRDWPPEIIARYSRRKPRQRWEKDIADAFGTMAAASRVAEDRHQFRRDIWAATA